MSMKRNTKNTSGNSILDMTYGEYRDKHPRTAEQVISDANLLGQMNEASAKQERERREGNWKKMKKGAAVAAGVLALTGIGANNLMDEADDRRNPVTAQTEQISDGEDLSVEEIGTVADELNTNMTQSEQRDVIENGADIYNPESAIHQQGAPTNEE